MLQRATLLSIVALTLAGASLLSRDVLGQRAPEWKVSYTDAQAKRGEAIYAANCQMCHMPNLMGGDIAPPVAGAGFVAKWSTRDVATLQQYIQVAMPMHSPNGLRPQQNADVLAFMLKKSSMPSGAAELQPLASGTGPAPVSTPAATIDDDRSVGRFYTEEQATRGRFAFNRHCGFCHSASKGGQGFAEPFLRKEVLGARVWPSVYYFFKKLEAMPAYDTDAISQETRADIAAYLLKQNGYPAGREALRPDYAAMKGMVLDEPAFRRVFNGHDFTGLRFALRPNCAAPPGGCSQTDPGSTFSVQDEQLVCDCKIHGYMYTQKKYLYFDLRFDYRWEKPSDWEGPPWLFQASNGVLIFVQDPDVWPKGIEVEGHERDLLQIYALQTKLEKTYDHAAVRTAQHPIGEWNSIRIVSSPDGTVKSYVNGVLGSTITRHEFAAAGGGHIAFQSQGARIMWRNIRIKSEDSSAP